MKAIQSNFLNCHCRYCCCLPAITIASVYHFELHHSNFPPLLQFLPVNPIQSPSSNQMPLLTARQTRSLWRYIETNTGHILGRQDCLTPSCRCYFIMLTFFPWIDSRCWVWGPGPRGAHAHRGRGSRFLPAQSSRGALHSELNETEEYYRKCHVLCIESMCHIFMICQKKYIWQTQAHMVVVQCRDRQASQTDELVLCVK